MARILESKCKPCRRLGMNLCGKKKCAALKRKFPPGFHGPKGYKRLTPYGLQLQEKQRARYLYNVDEKQMGHYYKKASKAKELTGLAFMQLLETRLDNVVYRLGFAETRRQARQMTSHGFIFVNGKKLDIPSYQVKVGDVVSLRESKKNKKLYQAVVNNKDRGEVPSWIHFDKDEFSGKVLNAPVAEDFKEGLNDSLIIEFYSR